MWSWFATHCHDYSPLYERISVAVANDPDIIELVRNAPPDAHLPPALLAAVHYLLLENPTDPLAAVYAGTSKEDPAPLFVGYCHEHRNDVAALLEKRRIQTNDCGRSALIAPGLTWLSTRLEGPLALVDVGASAGINLLCDRFRIDYGNYGATGPPLAAVQISCQVKGATPPIATSLPPIVARIGIDRSPIDLSDPDDARWLLACVWPDTGRLERTAAAIKLAQADPPTVVRGDGNECLSAVLAGLPENATPVVVTTWAFAYFSPEDRTHFISLLEAESRARPMAWLSAEGRGTVPAFAREPTPGNDLGADILGAGIFSDGVAKWTRLADVQEHGAWIDWQA